MVSLCGGHLLGERVVGFVVSDAVESLAVELGEADAVGLVRDEEIQNGPDEGEAAVLTGEAAHHLGPSFDLAERSLEQVGGPPPAAVAGWGSAGAPRARPDRRPGTSPAAVKPPLWS